VTSTTGSPQTGYPDRFLLGCHKRIGVQDYALSKSPLIKLLDQPDQDFDIALCEKEKGDIIEFALILLTGFLLGLRGKEIMKTDISGLLKYLDVGAGDEQYPHGVIPLIVRQ